MTSQIMILFLFLIGVLPLKKFAIFFLKILILSLKYLILLREDAPFLHGTLMPIIPIRLSPKLFSPESIFAPPNSYNLIFKSINQNLLIECSLSIPTQLAVQHMIFLKQYSLLHVYLFEEDTELFLFL